MPRPSFSDYPDPAAVRDRAQELRHQPGISARCAVPPRRLGKIKGPGWYWLIPFVDRVVQGRSADHHLSARNAGDDHARRRRRAGQRGALVPRRFADPGGDLGRELASATVQAAETALRDAIGQSELDHMLKDRAVDQPAASAAASAKRRLKWGVEIDSVEIKDVDIPEQMQRAIAKEAEAIREKRARIIRAEGENEAAAKLSQAAETDRRVPGALELRRLQTLSEIGVEHNTYHRRHASGRAGPRRAQARRHAAGRNPNGLSGLNGQREERKCPIPTVRWSNASRGCSPARRSAAMPKAAIRRPATRSTSPGASM